MKNINPLHVGLLLVTLVIFLVFKLHTYKVEFAQAQKELVETQKLAQSLVALKKVYGDKNKTLASLQRVLKHPALRALKVRKSIAKDSITLHIGSTDLRALNTLMNKVLNGAYNIKKLTISQLDATHARVDMEIQW